MKKFIFRLETLLRLRSLRERKLQQDLAHVRNKCRQAEEREKMLTNQIEALMKEMEGKRAAGELDLQDTYAQILDHFNVSLLTAKQASDLHARNLRALQEELKRAMQERKVIEKIKEKHYAGVNAHLIQEEGEELDEVGLKHH